MTSVPSKLPAAASARLLAELSDALDAADRLLPYLDLTPDEEIQALDVHARIQEVRAEVEALRRGRM